MFVQKQTLTMESKHTENMQTVRVLKDACRIIEHCCEHVIQRI